MNLTWRNYSGMMIYLCSFYFCYHGKEDIGKLYSPPVQKTILQDPETLKRNCQSSKVLNHVHNIKHLSNPSEVNGTKHNPVCWCASVLC